MSDPDGFHRPTALIALDHDPQHPLTQRNSIG
eukprot:COSAG06_NODE_65750_length_256_cov_0.656051_1_plen_31_part_10